jgi:hypothetical protein
VGEAENDGVLRALGALLREVDPPPDHLTRAARDLLTWRGLDAELAALLRTGIDRGVPPTAD